MFDVDRSSAEGEYEVRGDGGLVVDEGPDELAICLDADDVWDLRPDLLAILVLSLTSEL